jgi:hypothetical protein
MVENFWTFEDQVHECWRIEDVTFRSYQRIVECRRDPEEGGFRALRFRVPAIFPEVQNFLSVSDAQSWVVNVLGSGA